MAKTTNGLNVNGESVLVECKGEPSKTWKWAYIEVTVCGLVRNPRFFKTKKNADAVRRLHRNTPAVVGDVWNM